MHANFAIPSGVSQSHRFSRVPLNRTPKEPKSRTEVAMDIYIGFDSAWTDNPSAPGAICAVGIENGSCAQFHTPQLVSFDQALTFIQNVRSENGVTLIALDQPTLVPNLTSMRPVERTAASLISWLGGGVQPSNRGRLGMFCDAPNLGVSDDVGSQGEFPSGLG